MAKGQQRVERLLSYARGYAFGRGYVFGTGAKLLLTKALSAVVGDPGGRFAADPLAALKDAEQGLAKFIDAMITARQEVYSAGSPELRSNVIGEKTFDWVRAKLCPLFPVC